MSQRPAAAETHALFERVLDLDGAEERAAFLDAACAGRPALRARVDALLAADESADSILDRDPSHLWTVLLEDDGVAGRRLGPYRIVRELGRGGMGVVYLAERSDPDLRVALKVVGPRRDAGHLATRFRQERQILANLRHPNIAQLYDGGVTTEGLPYLAMEYVEGTRIDRWCDAQRLTLDARLRLFVTVCDAVHHAQQNLVVHRDLKPANILVTADGVVKLLDFGIAKLLPDESAPAPDATHTALHAFTPRYASPEQIRRDGVSTATDVYALGVVLYELMSGASPFPETTDPFAAARAVLETDPPPPSHAVRVVAPGAGAEASTSAETTAVARATPPDRLPRQLRGDIDAIVMKAIRKEPASRYASAAALRDDIQRHLRHEPVAARPDSSRYRLRKLVRRRRGAVAAAAALVLLLSSFATIHTTRITRERDRAELNAAKAGETRDFMLSLFTGNMPGQNLGDTLTVADMLARGVARTDSIRDQPELRALMLMTLGDVYRVLARYDEARPLIEQSVVEYRALGADSLGLADALSTLAILHFDLAQYEQALPPTREALAIQRRRLGEDDPAVLSSLANLATLVSHTGDQDEALEINLEILEKRRRLLGPDDPSIAYSLNNIAFLHYRADRLPQAERYFREALELRRRILPREHPDYALSLNNLAAVLRAQGRLDAAEPLFREALALRQDVLGADHPSLAVSHYALGRVLQMRGELDAAEPHFRAARAIDRRAYGPDHPEVGLDALVLARLLAERGDCDAAAPEFAEAARIFELAGRTEDLAEARAAREACSVSSGRP